MTCELDRLITVPGIGLVTGWTILAEVEDILHFTTDIKFAGYCRLVLGSKYNSGSRCHKSGNKDGNRNLRMAFGQTAVSADGQYELVKQFYKKIKRRSGKNVARALVGKELAKIVWHMLTKDEDY